MKKKLLLFMMAISAFALISNAQVTLKHAYTFEDGTADDTVSTGSVDGTLVGDSISIADGMCTVSGATINTHGYITLDGADLELYTYSAITLEAYLETFDGANGSYTMLAYFGNNTGDDKCLWIQPTRGGSTQSRVETNNGSATKTAYLDGVELDDGELHHVAAVLTNEALKYYLDGILVAEAALYGEYVSNMDTIIANIFKGPDGWADPNYNVSLEEFNIYDGELSAETISDHASAYLDLSSDSRLAGITPVPANTFYPNVTTYYIARDVGATSVNIDATPYNSGAVVTGDGNITITGTIDTVEITVASEDESDTTIYTVYLMEEKSADCYTPLYDPGAITNLVPDPECTDLSIWNGWGNRSIYYNVDSAYCGISCAMLEAPGAGCEAALDISGFTWKPNTTYRLYVMVKTIGGSIGFLANGSDPNFGFAVDTKGEWMLVDTIFTTGASAGTNFYSFNTCDYGSNCTKTYIDNYQLYEVNGISTLDNLLLSVSAVNELFTPSDTVYTAFVPIGTDTVFVSPVLTIDSASVSTTVDTVVMVNGAGASEIVVTALNGSSTKYTVSFTEADGNNYAMYLPGSDGNNSNVDISGLGLTTLPFTVEMWIKPDGTQTAYSGIFYHRGAGDAGLQYAAGWQDPTKLRFSGFYDSGSEAVTEDEWHHVAIVMTTTEKKIYLDGNISTQTGTFTPYDFSVDDLYLGWDKAVNDRAFKGAIDEVRVWNVERDSATLVDNMYAQYEGEEAGLVGYWNFDIQNPSYAVDMADNRLHGIITGGSYVPSLVRPFPDLQQTYYAIQTISKLAIGESSEDNGADIMKPDYNDEGQRLQIVETDDDGVYYIMNNNKTGFLYQDGGWNMKFATDTLGLSGVCLWKFVKGEGDTIYIQNANTDNYVASDDVAPGSSLYHDKAIDNPRGSWFFLVPDEVEFDFPVLEKNYYAIQTISGLALGVDTADNGAKVMVPRENDAAENLQIIASEDSAVYYILANNKTNFLARSSENTWSMLFVSDTTGISESCKWKFVKGEGDTVYIQNAITSNYVASDNVDPGSSVYHDKTIDNPRGSWLFLAPHAVYYFSSDATLSDLQVDGTTVTGFNANTLTYDVELPAGTVDPPTVTATATHENATVAITNVTELPDTAVIVVTAEDYAATKTYSIRFSVAIGIKDIQLSDVKIYPNPANNIIYITNLNKASISIYSYEGKLVKQFENKNNVAEINISDLEKGIYIIKIKNHSNSVSRMFIKK